MPFHNEFPIPPLRVSPSRTELRVDPVGREPGRPGQFSRCAAIATPRPQTWMRHHLRPYRIQYDIATQFQEVRVLFDQNRGKPALQQMPDALMPTVKGLRVAAIQLPHALREIGLGRFEQEMIVVVHQTVGVTEPAIPVNDMPEQREKLRPIAIIHHDVLPRIAAAGDVVDGVRKLDA